MQFDTIEDRKGRPMEKKSRWIQNMIAEAAKQQIEMPFDRKARRAKRLARLQRQAQSRLATAA